MLMAAGILVKCKYSTLSIRWASALVSSISEKLNGVFLKSFICADVKENDNGGRYSFSSFVLQIITPYTYIVQIGIHIVCR